MDVGVYVIGKVCGQAITAVEKKSKIYLLYMREIERFIKFH